MAKHKASCLRNHKGGARSAKKTAAPPPVKLGIKKNKRKEPPAAADKPSEVAVRPSKPHIPYSQEDHILLVGEGVGFCCRFLVVLDFKVTIDHPASRQFCAGNFSFGSALAGIIGSAELMVSTSYDNEEEIAEK